jgi:hypothetical protein
MAEHLSLDGVAVWQANNRGVVAERARWGHNQIRTKYHSSRGSAMAEYLNDGVRCAVDGVSEMA